MQPYAIYIYYRIPEEAETAAIFAAVTQIQHTLRQQGVTAQLRHKQAHPDTWMEIYESDADPTALLAKLDTLVTAHPTLPQPRHLEIFYPVTLDIAPPLKQARDGSNKTLAQRG